VSVEELPLEEFQRRIRANFPDHWDENGNFKHTGLGGFSRDGNHWVWFSNPEYESLKNDSAIEALRRAVKVEVPYLLDWKE
jgi:predicted Ser/Thr protein kinase